MAADKETREVEILLNAQQANASIKDMAAGVALMNNQLAKMSQDDPRRAQLQRDFQVLTQRVGAARAEMRTYVQTEEEVRAATEKLNQENLQVILNGQKLNSSFKDMKASAALLEKQLHEMNGDDPGRKKMLADYQALQGRIAGVTTEMKGATEGTSYLKQGFANAFAFFTGGGIIGLVQQLFGFFSASREEYLSSAKSAADLEATLVATKNAAGLTADEIRAIGTERAKYTLFDDDETNRASAMLLTFKNVKKGVFEEAIPAIQDLATKMAGDGPADLKGASIQLGKALNDPITGVTKLTKVGVTFTEQQKDQIAAMVKAGDTAGAQRVILGELNSEFGGSAEAARKAGGGVATLTMRWNEFKETVGGKVSGVLDSLSQWLGRVIDKSQPLLDMISEVGDEFADFFHEIGDVIESLGLFNDKTDSAGVVIAVLKGALTLLLFPLRLLVAEYRTIANAFIDWYNKSELLRGVLGGLGAVIKSLFYTIKDDAIKALGGVGDILMGIFTLDKNKIIAGFKSALSATADVALLAGERAAGQFMTGYEANKNNRITRTARVNTEEKTMASPGGTAASNGEDAPAGESEKARKAREAAEKKAQAARDKADRDRLEALKRWLKEEGQLLDTRDELKRARDEAANTDELKRQEAQRQKLFDIADKKVAALTGDEYDYAQQVQAIVAERDLALRELAIKFADEAAKQRKADLDKQIQDNEADAQTQLAQAEINHLSKLTTVQAYEDAVYEIKRAAAERELALVQQRDGQEAASAKKLQAEILKTAADQIAKEKAQKEALHKYELQLAGSKAQLLIEGLQLVEDNLDQQSTAYQFFKAARKTAALAEIGINLAQELSQNSLNAAELGPILGPPQLIIADGLSIVRAIGAGIKIAGFAKGGATGSGLPMTKAAGSPVWDLVTAATGLSVGGAGQLVDAQGLEVAGIVHKNEYVIPEWMRQDPQVLQVENWLEARRQRGFYQGGPTSDGGQRAVTATDQAAGTAQGTATDQRLVQVLDSLDQRLRQVEQWPNSLDVVLDLVRLDREQAKLKQVKTRGQIGPG